MDFPELFVTDPGEGTASPLFNRLGATFSVADPDPEGEDVIDRAELIELVGIPELPPAIDWSFSSTSVSVAVVSMRASFSSIMSR